MVHPYTRAKTTRAHLALIAVLLVVLALAPATVAVSVTSPDEPVPFLRQPWDGWAFSASVLSTSVSARAASPGAALDIAQRQWPVPDGGQNTRAALVAVQVKLLYLPGDTRASVRTIDADGRRSTRRLGARAPLVWQVLGRPADGGRVGTIGLVDFATGTVLWDVRGTSNANGKDATTT